MNERLPEVGDFRRYSPGEMARLLSMDVCGLYGPFAGPQSVNLPDTRPATAEDSLRGLRVDNRDIEDAAQALLQDPCILQLLLCLASGSGIAGEGDLLQTLYLVVTSRWLGQHRLHASLGEQSAAGKSELST